MTTLEVDPSSKTTSSSKEKLILELAGSQKKRRKELLIQIILGIAGAISVVITTLIIWSLVKEAWTFIIGVSWSDLWSIGWFPRRGFYDVKTLITATLITTAIAMLIATPLGLGAAIYLSEYASKRTRAWVKPILEILAGIPSVVIGFFALTWVAPQLVSRIGGPSGGSLAAAGIGVGILTIPLVASISEDAMRAVPNSLREASSGLGARKRHTIFSVIIPASISGLVASFIVATSRAVGETMVVFLAGGAADTAIFTASPFDGSLTMTAAMASLSSGTDNVVGEGLTFQSLFFVGLILFLATLILNIIANRFVKRIREKY